MRLYFEPSPSGLSSNDEHQHHNIQNPLLQIQLYLHFSSTEELASVLFTDREMLFFLPTLIPGSPRTVDTAAISKLELSVPQKWSMNIQ